MALAAREIYVEAMKERTSPGFKVAEQASRQMRVAESSAEIDAAGSHDRRVENLPLCE